MRTDSFARIFSTKLRSFLISVIKCTQNSFYRQGYDCFQEWFFFSWVTLYGIIQDKFFQHWNRVINMSELYIWIGITKNNNSDDGFEWKENQLWLLAKCCWSIISHGSYFFIANFLILLALRKHIHVFRHSPFPAFLSFLSCLYLWH